MRVVITENCMFIPRMKYGYLHTDRYYYKKPKPICVEVIYISYVELTCNFL